MLTYTQIAFNGAMALLMGLLIGIEREHSQEDVPLFAGIRTFPLITLFGFLCGLAAKAGWGWMLPVGLVGVSAIAVAAYMVRSQVPHKGTTTEFMALLAFVFGALAALGYLIPAATFAVVSTLLLSVKAPLHRLAESIQEDEIYAILKFGVVSVIILPLLPNRAFGPFDALNPQLIWWVVVLISALSMVGYVLMRFLGARQGIAVTGILGGITSSTAATFGLSHQARSAGESLARYFALGITIASTIMFVRVVIITAVIDAPLAKALALPIALPFIVGVGISIYLWKRKESQREAALQVKNPMELWSAIKFGLMFAVVMFASKAGYEYFGSSGMYVTGVLSGLQDVDPFTISAARLAHESIVSPNTANASILVSCATNTLVKGGIAAALGGRPLSKVIIPVFATLTLASLIACVWVAR
ncbi:MAG: MgtC/SapB family protein [Terriglobia bacterium]